MSRGTHHFRRNKTMARRNKSSSKSWSFFAFFFIESVYIPSGHAMPIDLWPTFQISLVSGFTAAREGGCLKLPRITASLDPSRKIKRIFYSDAVYIYIYSSPVNEWSPCGANHYLFLYTYIDVSEKEHALLPPSSSPPLLLLLPFLLSPFLDKSFSKRALNTLSRFDANDKE